MKIARKGIILAGGAGTRLSPLTLTTSKQLLPVYDKPMIYYPMSVLMLANIRDILIITTPTDEENFRRMLGSGENWGLNLTYAVQPAPEGLAQAYHIAADVKFLADGQPSALVLGDNLIYGAELTQTLRQASEKRTGATIFAYHVGDATQYGVVEFKDGKATSLEEKPKAPKSNYAVPGLYFYDGDAPSLARKVKPSARGELEITDLNKLYLERGDLDVEVFGRGTAWLDTGTHDSLLDAAVFVQVMEKRTGLKVACLEEIAFSKGWIDRRQLTSAAERYGKSSYATYLRALLSTEL